MSADVIAELSGKIENLQISSEEAKYGRKYSSTSSNGSTHNQASRRRLERNNSEVTIEAIFKELFSPDAIIIDNCPSDYLLSVPHQEDEDDDKRKVEARKSGKAPNLININRRSIPEPEPKAKIVEKKRSVSSKPPIPNFKKLASNMDSKTKSTNPYTSRNAIPLRRGLSTNLN